MRARQWDQKSKAILLLLLVIAGLFNMVDKLCAESDIPSKTSRSLTSEAEIRQIRENIANYQRAKEIASQILKAADEWVALSDRYVWEMIPPSDIPRAFNSSFEGCPVHGKEYFKFGNYSWKMDPFNKPWKLVCPVGGEEYPSNDFWAYYKTKDRSLLTGDYPDDGWGWRKPGDKYKHWFVGYYCHWLWYKYIIPAVQNLSFAYQITGDAKYARKAILMLDRIAELYPSMDHNKQSRYATEFNPKYQGKILNCIWETGVVSQLAIAYDNVFDILAAEGQFVANDSDSPLTGKTNAEIRQNIEKNLLREAVQAVFAGKIQGNYGMHQRTLLILALVLQDEKLKQRVADYIMNNNDGRLAHEGYSYALDNFILREGIAFESAPGYCLGWCSNLHWVAEYLDRLGVNIYSHSKLKRMFAAYNELKVLSMFTPAIGDSGDVSSGAIEMPTQIARKGLQLFGSSEFARSLLERGVFGEKSFGSYFDLRCPPLEENELRKIAGKAAEKHSGSRNLGGYGLAILEAGKKRDGVGAAIYYGPACAGHAHFDRLFMEVYGYGKKLIPDFGYPQFAAESKDPPAWERNTLSHYTVTVDASRQATQKKGILNQFAVTPEVRMSDISAPDAYPHLDEYRRVTLLIGSKDENPYFVDFFIVKGGKSHDYSIHGFTDSIATEGIELSAPQVKGTLAGENVPYGFLYDDLELEEPDKTRSYHSYKGSGYSYLYNVQRGIPSRIWSATWADNEVGIRAIFPLQDVSEVVVADGNPPKRPGSPESLKYVLIRNSGNECLHSRFICVLQPFKVQQKLPKPLEVRRIKTEGGDIIRIKSEHGVDYVYLAEDPVREVKVGGLLVSGSCVVLRMDAQHKLKSIFIAGGGKIRQGLLSVETGPSQKGRVLLVDFEKNEITIEADLEANSLIGKTILFGRSNYRIEYAHRKAKKLILGFGEYSPRTGKVVLDSFDEKGGFFTTKNLLYFSASGCYKDSWLINEDFSSWHRVADVEGGKIILKDAANLKSGFVDKNGDGRITAYFYDVAPSQEYEIPALCFIGRNTNGWCIDSNTQVRAELPDGSKLYQ